MVSLSLRASSLWRHPPIRESIAAFLWVTFALAAFIAVNSSDVRAVLSIPPDTTTNSLFLSAVAGQVLLWDYFDLALGCTLNPALALAFGVAGRLTPSALRGILAGQFLGHLAAVRAVRAVSSDYFVSKARLFAPPRPLDAVGMSFANAVAMEAGLTAVLAFGALSVEKLVRGQRAQSAVMLVVILIITAAGQGYTGAMLNPAMVLSLAVFEVGGSGVVVLDQFVYWLGPIGGALAGAALHRALFAERKHEARRRRILREQAKASAKVE